MPNTDLLLLSPTSLSHLLSTTLCLVWPVSTAPHSSLLPHGPETAATSTSMSPTTISADGDLPPAPGPLCAQNLTCYSVVTVSWGLPETLRPEHLPPDYLQPHGCPCCMSVADKLKPPASCCIPTIGQAGNRKPGIPEGMKIQIIGFPGQASSMPYWNLLEFINCSSTLPDTSSFQ